MKDKTHFDKAACVARARELISTKSEAALLYACLELRFCIEAIVYEKLQRYSHRIPKRLLDGRTWQPAKCMKALLQIEPDSDENFVMSFRLEDASGKPAGPAHFLGEHKTLKSRWIEKNWQKLGSHLHCPPVQRNSGSSDENGLRAYLEKIVQELQPIVDCRFSSSLAEVCELECPICSEKSVCNYGGIKATKRANCLNPTCEAMFHVEIVDDGGVRFDLMATTFDCLACGKPMKVENRHLEIGLSVTCGECKTVHQLLQRQWGYAKVEVKYA